jgi:Protein kinase domain
MEQETQETLRNGRYVVTRSLGEGSQGSTFEAVDKREGRLVAVKRFDVRGAKAWKDVELAEREARVLASLHHPNLPEYIEHFEENGRLYLAMEKIDGTSLAELLRSGKRFDEASAVRLLRDAAETLGYLHGQGVVHRDLKPGNVIQRKDGSFAFVDFGAVRDRMKPEGGSTVVGTFGFMAPEQFQGRAQPASDVYAIGATVVTMLTGRQPEDLPHRGLRVDVRTALRGVASLELTSTLERMLEPDPDRRAARIEVPRSIPPSRHQSQRRAARPRRPFTESWNDELWSEGWGMSRREARRVWKEARRARKEARKAARRRDRRRGPWVFAPLFVVLVGLAIARVAVSVAVLLVVPAVLWILSLVFGRSLRDAARAVTAGGKRAYDAIDEQARVLEDRSDASEPKDDARLRVSTDVRSRVRDEEPVDDAAWDEEEASGRGEERRAGRRD